MGIHKKPTWTLLEYASHENLDKAIQDREERKLFFPSVGSMHQGDLVDIQITVEGTNVLFPLKAEVLELRERPESLDKPRGVYLQIIEADRTRFDRLCAFVDRVWAPSARRSAPRLPAEIRASYFYPPRNYPAETIDVSARGMFLRTDGPLEDPGKPVAVRLSPSRLRSTIDLACQVRWTDQVENRRGMGLLCLGPPESMQRLTVLVNEILRRSRI